MDKTQTIEGVAPTRRLSNRAKREAKLRQQAEAVRKLQRAQRRHTWLAALAFIAALVAVVVLVSLRSKPAIPAPVAATAATQTPPAPSVPSAPAPAAVPPVTSPSYSTLAGLVAMPPEELAKVDVAVVNLLCAEGLPGAEGLEIDHALATLDGWAARVRSETARNLHLFSDDPARFHGNEGEYRFKMLVTVLQQDLGVAYNPARADPDESATSFFADSRDVFLHGLTAPERHLGTCASLPVLYAAVARRLGYPVRLVTARSHLFDRWDPAASSAQSSFNLEGTNRGAGTIHPDDYYLAWPKPISPQQREAEGYLTSLSATGELAVFLDTRGDCLRAAGRWAEAAQAYGNAARLMPKSRVFAAKLADAAGRAHAVSSPAPAAVAAPPEPPVVIPP